MQNGIEKAKHPSLDAILKSVIIWLERWRAIAADTAEREFQKRSAHIHKQWEASDFQPENPLHRIRGQALVWLFAFGRHLRQTRLPLRSYGPAVAITLAGLILTKWIHWGVFQVLLGAVLASVCARGFRSGLITASISIVALVLALRPTFHTANAFQAVFALFCFAIVSVSICLVVESREIERSHAAAERDAAELDARRFRFLAEATAMLETEYTYDGLLGSVTRAIVPALAHWAAIDVIDNGQFRRIAVSHQDDAIAALLRNAQRGHTYCIPSGHPLYEVLLTRTARIFNLIPPELIAPLGLGEQDSSALRPSHMLFVPLQARNRLVGVMTLISTRSESPFTATDLFVARDLALRVGAAMDNLRLYQGALDEAADLARREREASDQKSLLEQERSALVAVNARLEVEATTDGLTGLVNHMTFKRSLDQEIIQARQSGKPLSLALLDVDRFKSYNDKFGHPEGDEVLKRLSAIMRATMRQSDIVARYGGEEFVVVMPDTDARGAIETIERLRSSVEQSRWPKRQVTASVGIATLSDQAQPARDLIAAADEALYRAKQAGRNRVCHSEPPAEAVVFVQADPLKSRSPVH